MNISDKRLSDTEWSKRKNENEIAATGIDHIYKSPKLMSTSAAAASVYITLAKDSPPRHYDTDDTTYDSLNEQETDLCKDTSDTESSDYSTDHSEAIATMEVVEYEVASTSNDDHTMADSSSGTDDFVLAAVASALYSTNSSNEFAIFADTEESDDGTVDPEIGRADYWTCVKCKNKQNNPLYRFCEKCYQVRKSLFPPRPKCKKSRRNNKSPRLNYAGSHSSSLSSSSSTSSTASSQRSGNSMLSSTTPSTIDLRRKKIGKNIINKSNCNKNRKNNKQNSAGETSDTDSLLSDSDHHHNNKDNNNMSSSSDLSELKLKQHNQRIGKQDINNVKHYCLNGNHSPEKMNVAETVTTCSSSSTSFMSLSSSSAMAASRTCGGSGISDRVLNDSPKNESTNVLSLDGISSTSYSKNSNNKNNSLYSSSLNKRKRSLGDVNFEDKEDEQDLGDLAVRGSGVDNVDGASTLTNTEQNHLVKRSRNSDPSPSIEIPKRLNLNNIYNFNSSLVANKDSGISSCSSQDLSPILDIDSIKYSSSQETFCSDTMLLDDHGQSFSGGSSGSSRVKKCESENETVETGSANVDDTISAATLQQSISTCSDRTETKIEPIGVIHCSKSTSIEDVVKQRQLIQSSFVPDLNSPTVTDSNLGLCMFCMAEPKNGVFVHNKFLHLCCCYKCAVKVWKQRKSCPVCNCKVKNVMKLFAH